MMDSVQASLTTNITNVLSTLLSHIVMVKLTENMATSDSVTYLSSEVSETSTKLSDITKESFISTVTARFNCEHLNVITGNDYKGIAI